jgi:hypothetical protein
MVNSVYEPYLSQNPGFFLSNATNTALTPKVSSRNSRPNSEEHLEFYPQNRAPSPSVTNYTDFPVIARTLKDRFKSETIDQ